MTDADRLDALAYHELTKHSVASVQSGQHSLDWGNQPLPFKIYPKLKAIPLPRDFDEPRQSPGEIPDLRSLARVLHYTAGITRKKIYPGGQEQLFRAAACTGALYHIDLYVACGALAGLEAGVYHFGPHDFALRRLRSGDHRRIVLDATGAEPAAARAPVLLICTSTFWRNAWKYESRTYRHCFWDTGTMLANFLGVAEAAELPAEIVLGFADDPVNELLGLDTNREVSLACLALGRAEGSVPEAAALVPLAYETTPLSHSETEYPAILAAHASSKFDTPEQAQQWRQQASRQPRSAPGRPPSVRLADSSPAVASVEEVIAHRGSARRFAREPISFDALSHILRAAVVDVPADFSPPGNGNPTERVPLNDLYVIANAVDGLEPGSYVYHDGALELLRTGDFRRDAGFLDLGQELAADASVNFYSLSDLSSVIERFGNRGYRAAALEAALVGGRIYLAAYGLGLGATGLTFFDDLVTEFFSPHAAGKGVMFLTAVGHPHRQRRRH